MPWMPLNFTHKAVNKPSIFSRLMGKPKPVMQVYNHLINFLVDPVTADSAYIETTLQQKWLSEYTNRRCSLKLLQNRVISSKLLDERKICGVFMHRELNMPSSCYSFESIPEGALTTYHLKKQFGRSTDLQIQQQIKKKYEEEDW